MESNIILGIIGGICGAIIGGILWVAIGQFGFIAGIAGYAIVFLSVKGFAKLGGGLTKTGVIFCVVVSILTILLSEYVSTGLAIYSAFKHDYQITIMDAMKSVPAFLEEKEVVTGILKDLLIGYALAVWASFSYVKNLLRSMQA